MAPTQRQLVGLVLCGRNARIKLKLRRSGIRKPSGQLEFAATIDDGIARALRIREGSPIRLVPAS